MTPNANSGMPFGRVAMLGVAAIAVVAAVLTAYVVLSPSSTHAAPTPSPASLVERFAVLREAPDATPPSELAQLLGRARERFGLDVEGARYSQPVGAWLIPGKGWMCIAAEDPDGLGMSCSSAESALSGQLSLVEHHASDDVSTVIGAAPDGNSQAVGEIANGTVSAAVQSNAFTLQAAHLQRVSLR